MSSQTHPPARLRSSLANVALAVEERVVWSTGDAIRSASDAVKWPFERGAWAIERGLIWPLQERLGGWNGPLRAAAVGAVALAAVVVGVAGLLWAAPDNGGSPVAAQTHAPASLAIHTSQPPPSTASGPTLHGAAPVFTPPASGDAAKVAGEEAVAAPTATSASKAGDASTSSAATAATGQPAGPAAIKVARQFSDAFVLYETGEGSADVRTAFAATATPELAHSLLKRPPRLPANVKVPRAKVLNVVPAPSSDGVYPVSVSLLRVGLTSELRLDIEWVKKSGTGDRGPSGLSSGPDGGKWLVTDVLG